MTKHHRSALRGAKTSSRFVGWNWVPLVICMAIGGLVGQVNLISWANENAGLSGKGHTGTSSEAEVAEKIDALEKRIQIARAAEKESTAKQMGVTLADLIERTAQLKSIQSVYERVLTALPLKNKQRRSYVKSSEPNDR
jgi:hypothetical protein